MSFQRTTLFMLTAQQLITQYQLQPHPEGGFYLQTYCSNGMIPGDSLPNRFKGSRYFSTAIYFLLEGKQFSAFHRIQSDELWHFYKIGRASCRERVSRS